MDERLCRVEKALGRREACPESACPFWRTGERPSQGHCSLDGLDLAGREAFAQWLHERRTDFGGGAPPNATSAEQAVLSAHAFPWSF